jgi:hypothetical protein
MDPLSKLLEECNKWALPVKSKSKRGRSIKPFIYIKREGETFVLYAKNPHFKKYNTTFVFPLEELVFARVDNAGISIIFQPDSFFGDGKRNWYHMRRAVIALRRFIPRFTIREPRFSSLVGWEYWIGTQSCSSRSGVYWDGAVLRQNKPESGVQENKDKRLELNRLIRKVRQQINVRAKLGAFDLIKADDPQIFQDEQHIIGNKGAQFSLLKILESVNEDDVSSFHTIVKRSLVMDRSLRFNYNIPPVILRGFNKLIKHHKDGLLLAARACYL